MFVKITLQCVSSEQMVKYLVGSMSIASSQIICMVYIPMPERGFLSMLCNS